MTTYALGFFLPKWHKKGFEGFTSEEIKSAAAKAVRGSLKPGSEDHFCGVERCTSAVGGCRVRREYGVPCTFVGDYTWPKD
jgi:hypothetical protein